MQAILCEVLFEFNSSLRTSVSFTHNNNNNKKRIWLASLLLEPQTLSKKCGILMLKENNGNLATCFKTLNGTIELSQKV